MLVFDLTRLATAGDDAHDRTFSDVTSVMGVIQQRLSRGPSMTDHRTVIRTVELPGIEINIGSQDMNDEVWLKLGITVAALRSGGEDSFLVDQVVPHLQKFHGQP